MSFSDTPTLAKGNGCMLSVLISSIVTAVVITILFSASGLDAWAVGVFLVAFAGALIVIGLSAVLLGLPLTQLLESNGWERPWSYPLAGFLLGGAIAYLIAVAIDEAANMATDQLFLLLTGALPGALCGGLWWWFERRHVQGRDDDA